MNAREEVFMHCAKRSRPARAMLGERFSVVFPFPFSVLRFSKIPSGHLFRDGESLHS
jgi:hypothetical protein